jgi:hypothetical protein
MRYFLPMRRTRSEKATEVTGTVHGLGVSRLADPGTPPPMGWQRSHIGRALHASTAVFFHSCAVAARRTRLAWSDFRTLSRLEQTCWAFLAVSGVVCITLRVLEKFGLDGLQR